MDRTPLVPLRKEPFQLRLGVPFALARVPFVPIVPFALARVPIYYRECYQQTIQIGSGFAINR